MDAAFTLATRMLPSQLWLLKSPYLLLRMTPWWLTRLLKAKQARLSQNPRKRSISLKLPKNKPWTRTSSSFHLIPSSKRWGSNANMDQTQSASTALGARPSVSKWTTTVRTTHPTRKGHAESATLQQWCSCSKGTAMLTICLLWIRMR